MAEAEVAAPAPMADTAFGPDVLVGQPVEVADLVVRLTAPNANKMTGPGTNTYLVGDDEVVVIDPGPVILSHLDAIERTAADRGSTIRWIAVTHHHADHAPAAVPLGERTGAELLAFGHADGAKPDRAVTEGFVLRGPGFSLAALHTPGHASDHLCWLLEADSLLFSGDHVMQGSTVVIRPPDGNMIQYLASLQRLADRRPSLRAVAPGHGRLIGDPAAVIDGIMRHRLDREVQVVVALQTAAQTTIDELLPIVYADVPENLLDVARHSLRAHLDKLVVEGKARVSEGENDPVPATAESTRWEPVGGEGQPAGRVGSG